MSAVRLGANTADIGWILTAQAGRAFGYGLAAVLLGATLAARGLTPPQVGLVLAAVVADTVVASLVVGALADRLGRRRTYLGLYLALAGTGVVYASTSRWPVLAAAALVGVLSTEVVESGPFTTVEQAMLATAATDQKPLVTGFGRYNWLQHRYTASTTLAGVVMFVVGLLQTASFLAAPRIARRIGLLPTMVATHLPSNLLLAALAIAPSLSAAVGLLLARTALSQMDVPTRQAYVMTLVPAGQRSRAAAVTNTARYLTRPVGTALLGPAQLLPPELPFLLAGAIKTGYDLTLWTWFRHVLLPEPTPAGTPSGGTT